MKSRDEIMKSLMCRVRGCLEKCDHRCDMCELYVPNYRLEDRYADAHAYIQQLEERNSKLEYTLLGVMHSVDKWLNVEPYDFDKDDGTVAATRASNAREIALKAIEKLQKELQHERDQIQYRYTKLNPNRTVHDIQVIGNIFDNPELLEEANNHDGHDH